MNTYTSLLLALILAVGAGGQDTEPEATLLGDYHDGSQAQPIHHLTLYDAGGFRIFPGVNDDKPVSLRITCGRCHDVGTIGQGWHFSLADDPGRPGEPWVYWDATLATQIPLSQRAWPGVFEPNRIGLSDWWFVQAFGRHMPGGQVQPPAADADWDPDDRWEQSGAFETNCLACHDAAATHDQSQAAEQIAARNYAWAATATSDFAYVTGAVKHQARTWEQGALGQDAPVVHYAEERFFAENQVQANLTRRVPNGRCLFCHSHQNIPGHDLDAQEDVHLAAGMACVDCHRNGLDHRIVRGYECEAADVNDPARAALSCRGCHLGTDDPDRPTAGRLTAPHPAHKGIPTIHFESLSCTACHSGPWPAARTVATKTSRSHALGTRRVNHTDATLPHLQTPVFVRGDDGKLAPHRLMWPAYWGWLAGEAVRPAKLETVRRAAQGVLRRAVETTSPDWPALDPNAVGQVLTHLQERAPAQAQAVYVSGGKLYRQTAAGVVGEEHPAAAAVTWPLAHNVRPAEQSLGVRSCRDCHDEAAGMLFGEVAVDSALGDPNATVSMARFHGLPMGVTRAFAQSFVFRPWMKVVTALACLLILGVLATYVLRALACVAQCTVSDADRD